MKILLAPDAFKGSLTAARVAELTATGLGQVLPDAEVIVVPVADGGEGTAAALVSSAHGGWKSCPVSGPRGEITDANLGLIDNGRTAVVLPSLRPRPRMCCRPRAMV